MSTGIVCRALEGPFEGDDLKVFSRLAVNAFGDYGRQEGTWRLENMPAPLLCLAFDEDRPVAFKAGYALSSDRFYSWLGAVEEDYRRRGIGSQLMLLQHERLSTSGFRWVETRVEAGNERMAALNRRSGFLEIGSVRQGNTLRTVFEKAL